MGSDLDELCQKNLNEFGTALYWYCPLPSKDNEGCYFVLVREGVLYLPYNHVYDRDEEFALGDAKLFDAGEIFQFKSQWDTFTEEASGVLETLAHYAMERGDDE